MSVKRLFMPGFLAVAVAVVCITAWWAEQHHGYAIEANGRALGLVRIDSASGVQIPDHPDLVGAKTVTVSMDASESWESARRIVEELLQTSNPETVVLALWSGEQIVIDAAHSRALKESGEERWYVRQLPVLDQLRRPLRAAYESPTERLVLATLREDGKLVAGEEADALCRPEQNNADKLLLCALRIETGVTLGKVPTAFSELETLGYEHPLLIVDGPEGAMPGLWISSIEESE